MTEQIFVKSHVARDLLQSAALFKTDRLAVWEYVSNGLQYVDAGTNPIVTVSLDSKKKVIRVVDRGRGMDWDGLKNFFLMHGENLDRQSGRPGRGRFGTGKSAAFGIGAVLRITSVKNGLRSCVELRRDDIDGMSSEDPVPVRTIEREVSSEEPNGTCVEIEQIHLKAIDQAGIIKYVERHLARWPRNATVLINNHECEYFEPPVEREIRFSPEGELRETLGAVELIAKVSKAPLDEDLRGVSIFANGVWYETTLAGSEGREMAPYIFGEIDVPNLDADESPIPPFDMSRSMKLNPSNDLVMAIYAFVGSSVEEVRRQLVTADRRRREGEDARRLAQQAAEIAKVINEDFDDYRQRIAKARAKASGNADPRDVGSTGSDDLIFGSEIPAEVVSPTGGEGRGRGRAGEGEDVPDLGPQVVASEGSPNQGSRVGGAGETTRRPRGGFRVEFDNLGFESYRAQYVRDDRTILINLDHPQIAAAKGQGSKDDLGFRRLAYEVAFSEYSVALASELAARDEYLDPSDPIVDIRDTLNRLARKGAQLYLE